MVNIQRAIMDWYDQNKRDLPWRRSKDPYLIWLSEIVLQQTRVDQGEPFFNRLATQFPSVQALAAADEADVLLAWKGLGYYSRARNLHKAAKQLTSQHAGRFPENSKALTELPGVGPYTAAAIASICFDEHVAAIDGNIIRVVSRVMDISQPVENAKTLALIKSVTKEWLPLDRPGDFNQALMDFGSLVCTPKSPNCLCCPLSTLCLARSNGTQNARPVKKPKKKAKDRYLIFHLEMLNRKFRVVQMGKGGIWENLYVFPFNEYNGAPDMKQALNSKHVIINSATHVLSHQRLTYSLVGIPYNKSQLQGRFVSMDGLSQLPTPILMVRMAEIIQNQTPPII
jgi:A/G-specific adenine glycosylase